jgi:predicted RNA-binding protein YlxR (DUF448 family)
VRLARRPDGGLAVSRSHPGRGAWLCRDAPSCLRLAARRNAFERALRAPVDEEAIHALGRELGMAGDVGGYEDLRARPGSA